MSKHIPMNYIAKQLLTVVCLAVLPAVSFAYDVEIDGIYYDLGKKTKTATVVSNGKKSYSGAVIIPEGIKCT